MSRTPHPVSLRSMRRIIPVILASVLLGIAAGARAPKLDDSDRLKASYIFMEGVSAINDSRFDDALLLLDRAAQLDPDDRDISAVRGELIFATTAGDSAQYAQAYAAIRDRFLANPTETNGLYLARLAARLYRADDVRMAYRMLHSLYPARTDFALTYAGCLAEAGKRGEKAALDSALKIYDTLEAGLGPDAVIIGQRIKVLAANGDSAAIVEQLHHLYSTAPSDPETNLNVGVQFFSVGLPDSAIVYIDRAVELDSTYGDAVYARADYYLKMGDSIRYDKEVFRALKNPGLDFVSKIGMMSEYVRSLYDDPTHRDEINRLFAVMQDIHPGEAELHHLYGAYLATIDSTAAAAEQFGYAVDLDPEQEQNWMFLVQTALSAGETDRAIDAGRKAMHRFPDNLYFPVMAASLVYQKDGAQAALGLIDSVDISDFNNPAALSMWHTARGDYLYHLELVDSAFAEYDRAIRLNPSNDGALNNAAYFMALSGRDLDRANSYATAALHEQPTNPTYIDTYAWVLYKQGNYEEARHQIDIVLGMTADSIAYEYADTDTFVTVDSVPTADSSAVAATEVPVEVSEVLELADPYEPSAEVLDHAGDIYFRCGEHEQAVELWRRALLLDPDNKSIADKIRRKSL